MDLTGTDLKIEIIKKIKSKINCPLCSIITDYEFNLLAKIQYDITFDENFRKQIASEGGFCDFHFRQFKKIANAKTNMFLLLSIIESEVYMNIDFENHCRICKSIDLLEKKLIENAVDLFHDFEFQDIFKNSYGLCNVHIKTVLQGIKEEELRNWIIKTHREQIERLKLDLNSMISVESYFEISADKRKLIGFIIEKFAGRKSEAF
jgi:hypothetical protein